MKILLIICFIIFILLSLKSNKEQFIEQFNNRYIDRILYFPSSEIQNIAKKNFNKIKKGKTTIENEILKLSPLKTNNIEIITNLNRTFQLKNDLNVGTYADFFRIKKSDLDRRDQLYIFILNDKYDKISVSKIYKRNEFTLPIPIKFLKVRINENIKLEKLNDTNSSIEWSCYDELKGPIQVEKNIPYCIKSDVNGSCINIGDIVYIDRPSICRDNCIKVVKDYYPDTYLEYCRERCQYEKPTTIKSYDSCDSVIKDKVFNSVKTDSVFSDVNKKFLSDDIRIF